MTMTQTNESNNVYFNELTRDSESFSMKILLILDPLKNLNVNYDTSLAMVRTFTKRGHLCYFADAPDLFVVNGNARAKIRPIYPEKESLHFKVGAFSVRELNSFDAILVRKEPPFNMAFVYMTYMLELVVNKTLVLNDPRGLRDANEKFSSVEFPRAMPRTLVSASSEQILSYQTRTQKDLILKPLDERGGRGLVLLKKKDSHSKKNQLIRTLTQNNVLPIIAQEFISKPKLKADKRIFLLEGKFLAAYERHFAPGDFRGNLGQGAVHKKTTLSSREIKVMREISPWLKRHGLHFVGLDLLDGKLLEINVTCPGGFPEADELYPNLRVFEKFAESVEKLAK